MLANEATTALPRRARRRRRRRRRRGRCSRKGGVGGGLEVLTLSRERLGAGLASTHFLVAAGVVSSGKEAKRLIGERGLRFNNELVLDPNALVTEASIGRELKVSVGRKRHAMVRLEG